MCLIGYSCNINNYVMATAKDLFISGSLRHCFNLVVMDVLADKEEII